jgi:hypothetical protein
VGLKVADWKERKITTNKEKFKEDDRKKMKV